jgi:hypothetical protein
LDKRELLSQSNFPSLSIVNMSFGGAGQLQSMTWPSKGAVFN